MQTEARVGVVVEGGGGQRALDSGHGGVVVDGGPSHKFVAQRMTLNQQSQIGTISELLAGGVAGAVSKTCTAPLARLTILFQVQGMHSDVTMRKACIWREASRIVREEGFRAFWKGNLVTIAHRLPYSSVSFYAFERYKNLLHFVLGTESRRENVRTDFFIRLVGGGLAGITAASLTYPLDLVRTRLAAQTNIIYYRGIWHALCTISREEGVSGLYKGLGTTLLGVGPNLAISFSVYETLRSYWQSQRPDDSTAFVDLACGSLSGIASSTGDPTQFSVSRRGSILFEGYWQQLTSPRQTQRKLITFPLDLVRRRMQLEGAGGRARVYHTGLFGTFGYIIRTEGMRGLYRGILPEYYKVVPTIGMLFMTNEKLKQIFSETAAN